ncbi:MAG: hypothetical protein HQ582_23190 [Planctomycetes bacterium]|nr:hypothetical protein [Planctomycetota bacterium]
MFIEGPSGEYRLTRGVFALLVSLTLQITAASAAEEQVVPDDALETPAQTWQRCQETLLPFNYEIQKDEIVPSDTRPTMKLRRVEVKFYSQELNGQKWGHPCVVYMPADEAITSSPDRLGKCVIVGQRGWDGLATGPWRPAFLGNYGEPIAAETGYPTMICPHPGEYDETPGKELSIGFLRDRWAKTRDNVDHSHIRLAIIYLRALDVMAEVMGVEKGQVRAIIGGHSKRATCAHCAATADPRILGVVYMGNESTWSERHLTYPERALFPPVAERYTSVKTLYIGGTNEDGYTMYNINRIISLTGLDWTVAMVPNYRHASMSEKHFINWKMWTAHCFEERPVTRVSDLVYEEKDEDFEWGGRQYGAGGGTLFECKIDTPNKIIQAKVWYVYCDDEPYWRDLVWYPEFMIEESDGVWAGYVKGRLPDAWLVEVKDIAHGRPGYVTSLPQDITGKQTMRRISRGSRSRNWTPITTRP